MPDLSDIEKEISRWHSRNSKWEAKLVRNYAGAHLILEYKNGRSCGCMSAGTRYHGNDNDALIWAQEVVPLAFDVGMIEAR